MIESIHTELVIPIFHAHSLSTTTLRPQMDQNRAEKLLRIVALVRKKFYGPYTDQIEISRPFASLFQIGMMHDLEPMVDVNYYLDVSAQAGGVSVDLEPYLPWHFPLDKRQEYSMPKEERSQRAYRNRLYYASGLPKHQTRRPRVYPVSPS